jgi:ABC-type transport system involved in multi-copper enzyme maturation permease subunit
VVGWLETQTSPLASTLAALLRGADPFEALPHGWPVNSSTYVRDAGRSLLVWAILGTGCVALASLRLKPRYIRQLEGEGRKRRQRWWRARRPPVSDSPLRWKERHVEGVAPLALLRSLPRWLGVALVFAATVLWGCSVLVDHLPPGETGDKVLQRISEGDWLGLWAVAFDLSPASGEFFGMGILVMFLASLVVGIRCSGAVTGERERQTWEALLLAPLETPELIRGKLWGIVGATYPYLLAYALPALALAVLGGLAAAFWTALWLAVTWLAMCYVGAAGLWCSVRSKGSWRSLLGTLAFTYLGGFVLYCVLTAISAIVAMVLVMILEVFQSLGGTITPAGVGRFVARWMEVYAVAFCFTLAGAFALLTWQLLKAAEYRVGVLERTKQWKNPARRSSRSFD